MFKVRQFLVGQLCTGVMCDCPQIVSYTVSLLWCLAIVGNQIDYAMKPWPDERKEVKQNTLSFDFAPGGGRDRCDFFSDEKTRHDFRKNSTLRLLDLERDLFARLLVPVDRRESRTEGAERFANVQK